VLTDTGFDPKQIGRLAIGRLNDRKRPYLDHVISSSIDVDRMDFLVRDSFHTGAGYGSIDVHRLLYSMDILDGNLAVDGTAIAALESFLLARLESFRTIYFHRASRAVQIMLVRALDLAKEDLGLLKLDDPTDYLRLDDYAVWTGLKGSKKSRAIIEDLEMRRLLKCTYERTLYATEELVSNVITKQTVRDDIQKEIARKARVPVDDVIIDVPTLPSVPYHNTVGVASLDIPVFLRLSHGRKKKAHLAEVSRVGFVLRAFMNLVRVYTKEKYRDRVEHVSKQVLGETPVSTLSTPRSNN
ncbi:MAG TPA: hypothetical protein VE177_02825, partial [Candidatus Binatus sp.]|nr:hypothetical protein [Candidatus Binatus sp.]